MKVPRFERWKLAQEAFEYEFKSTNQGARKHVSSRQVSHLLRRAYVAIPPIMMNALHLIIMQSRINVNGKQIRTITEVSELAGLEGSKPRLNTLFKWNGQSNQLEETGVPSKLRERISKAAGVAPRQFDEMAQNRQKILESLVQRNIDDIGQVSTVVQNYYAKM